MFGPVEQNQASHIHASPLSSMSPMYAKLVARAYSNLDFGAAAAAVDEKPIETETSQNIEAGNAM